MCNYLNEQNGENLKDESFGDDFRFCRSLTLARLELDSRLHTGLLAEADPLLVYNLESKEMKSY